MDLDSADLKAVRSYIFKMKIAKFFSSNIVKIIIILFSYGLVTLGHIGITVSFELITTPKLCTLDNFKFANGISSMISPISLALFLILFGLWWI